MIWNVCIRSDDLQYGPYLYNDGGGARGGGANIYFSFYFIKISASLVKVLKFFSALLEK